MHSQMPWNSIRLQTAAREVLKLQIIMKKHFIFVVQTARVENSGISMAPKMATYETVKK